jgi:histidyl-tRNA synthetase
MLGRGMKGQMKDADRSGARFAAIIGEDELSAREVTLKDLSSGKQERVAIDRLEEKVRT